MSGGAAWQLAWRKKERTSSLGVGLTKLAPSDKLSTPQPLFPSESCVVSSPALSLAAQTLNLEGVECLLFQANFSRWSLRASGIHLVR